MLEKYEYLLAADLETWKCGSAESSVLDCSPQLSEVFICALNIVSGF